MGITAVEKISCCVFIAICYHASIVKATRSVLVPKYDSDDKNPLSASAPLLCETREVVEKGSGLPA